MADPDGVVIEHPNREKTSSKTTKAIVVVLLLVSATLTAVITVGGWDKLVGAKGVTIFYIVIYVVIAYFVARWKRGLLPVASALGIILLIFAAVSAPLWYERDDTGFTDPALAAGLLGLLTLILIPLQVLLIAFAMRGFSQAWNVEVERPGDAPAGRGPSGAPMAPSPA